MANKSCDSFRIEQVSWTQEKAALRLIRTQVFIVEQKVPVNLEWDDDDKDCLHLLVYDHSDQPAATARMLSNGHIGRMAVLKNYRGQGIGSQLLKKLLAIAAERNLSRVKLHAQTHAQGFYQKHNFSVTSDIFMDAGIAHVAMEYQTM